jgi:type II secretory pathway component PulJ
VLVYAWVVQVDKVTRRIERRTSRMERMARRMEKDIIRLSRRLEEATANQRESLFFLLFSIY